MATATYSPPTRKPETRQRPLGANIHDLVLEFNPETGEWQFPTICLLNNAPVLRKDWAATFPAETDAVEFVDVSHYPMGGGGGGSNPLQIILTVVIMVVAWYAGPAAAGLMGFTQGSAAFSAVSSLVSAAVMVAGSLLMGAIFKTPALMGGGRDMESASPTYGIGGSNNQARLYGVIGEGFGRMQIVPDRAANAWGYYIGNDMYLYQVMALGRGLYELESLAFGDTVFWRHDSGLVAGYEVELQFLEPGQTVTLFPDNVSVSIEVSGQEVFPSNHPEYAGWLGPFSANPPGTETDRIVNNIIFGNGGGWFDNNGRLQPRTFTVQIQYQAIDDLGQPQGDWQTLIEQPWTLSTPTPQRFSLDVPVEPGRYQIRTRRLDEAVMDGENVNGRWNGRMAWESLFSFLPGTLSYNQSVVAMRIKASNVITQQASSSLRAIYTRKLPLYDRQAKTWSEPVPTRKFAAALSSVLKTSWGGDLPDNQIDLEALWGHIDPILTAKNWTFDGYFDGPHKVWDLVLEMCQPFRVVPRITAGGVAFIYDQPGRPVRHVFTPHNIIRGSFSRTFNTFSEETPDDVIWSYLDEDAGFQGREVRCVLPDSESKTPAIRNVVGIVNRDQGHKVGLYQAAVNRKRRIITKFQTGAVARNLLMGDVCAVNHPYFSDLASGEIQAWNEETLSLDLGAELPTAPAGDFYLALTRPDGTPWGPCKISAALGREAFLDRDDFELLLSQGLENPFEWVDFGQGRVATVWTIQGGREFSGRVIITTVSPMDPWHYEVTCINDDPTVDDYNDIPTPPWGHRGQTGGTFVVLPPPSGLTASGLGSPEAPIVRLTWLPVAGAVGYRVEQSVGAAAWGQGENITINSIEVEASPGPLSLRVAARDSESRLGPWSRWSGDVEALFSPAPALEGVYAGARAALSWSAPAEATGMEAVSAWHLIFYEPNGFTVARAVDELPPDEEAFIYTPEMGAADGGPWRVLNVGLRYRTVRGVLSDEAELTLTDFPPTLLNASFEVGADSVTITEMEVDGDGTGLVIIRGNGPDFGANAAVEMRTADTLPFTWGGLTPGTAYYFRLAAKDAFFDVAGGPLELFYSAVQAITTAEA